MENIGKYKEIYVDAPTIARLVGCSSKYVRLLLSGERTQKTDKAIKAIKVFEIADYFLELKIMRSK